MLSFRCRTTLFWDPAVLLLLNTKDLTKILGENREYFIRIISFEGMYPQQSAYDDASFAECSKLFSAACEILCYLCLAVIRAIQISLALWVCFYKIIIFLLIIS